MEEFDNSRGFIIGPSKVGDHAMLAQGVIVGHPSKDTLLNRRDFYTSRGAVVGQRCILRSGTIIYEDAVIGNDVQTAHNVVIREGATIGDGCVFGNGSVVREKATLGRNVRLMESVVISEGARLGNDIFIGPNVSFTAGRFMTGALEASGRLNHDEARELEGDYWEGPSVVVEDDVRIGANAVILAGVRLGKGCVIAAGAVVSMDVQPGALMAGNPARLLKRNAAVGP
ncbi:MAG: N-acetyltransferase [Blastocatellia bacterium]|nr:N-acetyltransferase [Blastocatellia bacterium]